MGNAQILNVDHLDPDENFMSIGKFRDQIQGGNRHEIIDMPGTVPTVSQHVSMNGVTKQSAGSAAARNGFIPNGRNYYNHY